jgi:hypothetical protein
MWLSVSYSTEYSVNGDMGLAAVLKVCEGQLAVPASNFTLCGYVLEYYSALFVCLSQLMFVILPYIYC